MRSDVTLRTPIAEQGGKHLSDSNIKPKASRTGSSSVQIERVWTTSLDANVSIQDDAQGISTTADLVSQDCRIALQHLFQNPATLSVATEASSHPAGLLALQSQPWVYAGGGLGNEGECLALSGTTMQTCLAGAAASRAATLSFARLCWPVDCTAHDLVAMDLLPTLSDMAMMNNNNSVVVLVTHDMENNKNIAAEYQTQVLHMLRINRFLQTGWTCGYYQVPWNWMTAGPLLLGFGFLIACCTLLQQKRKRRGDEELLDGGDDDDEEEQHEPLLVPKLFYSTSSSTSPTSTTTGSASSSCATLASQANNPAEKDDSSSSDSENESNKNPFHWLDAFNMRDNYAKLWYRPSAQTASLDGMRVISLLWIILGHVMAIVSSTGPGYSNPVDFLPPHGWTTTWTGQLLFSSRLAVDTFFCLSGFLLVHVLERKSGWSLPQVIVSRLARLWPLYAATLAFYTQLAPHLNGGPFWHQWRGLLQPCDKWLANMFFVNNMLDTAVADTCFYHSWYLAVDLQLFVAGAALLWVLKRIWGRARSVLVVLFVLSVLTTAYMSWVRKWSINTFDGAAVARYDVEGYAQPHVRAQAYLAGMYVALLMRDRPNHSLSTIHQRFLLWSALAAMAFVTFVTATGAYAQRPCQYQELPGLGHCGSTWSPLVTFLYTAFSRTLWVLGVSIVMYICMTNKNGAVSTILAWPGWLPLSHLSFGVYLIHPIVIFVWQLGGRDKSVFRLVTFGMNYLSVCVMSYVAALVAALLVELPCAGLWKHFIAGMRQVHPTPQAFRSQQPLYRDHSSVGYGSTSDIELRE